MMGGALSRRSSAFFVYCLIFTSGMKEYLKLTEARACGYNRIKRRHGKDMKRHGKSIEMGDENEAEAFEKESRKAF